MIARLLAAAERLGLHPSVLAALFSLSAKVFGSILGLVVFAIAARGMSETAFGSLAVTYNVASFLAVIGVLGQDALIIRNWAETRAQNDDGASLGALLFGLGATLAAGGAVTAAFAGLCFLNASMGEARALPLPGGAGAVAAASAFLFAQALLHFMSHAARAICGVRVSEPHSEVTWRLLLLIVFLIATAFVGREEAGAVFFFGAALGCFVAVMVQAVAVLRALDASIRAAAPLIRARAWMRRSLAILSAVGAEAASQYAEVVIIGVVASPAVSAAYFVCARIAGVFPMVAAGLHGYLSSRFANLYYAGRLQEAQGLIARVMLLGSLVVGVLAVAVVDFGDRLLAIFGESYAAEYMTLLVLSGAAAFTTLMGPGATIMLATGHELFYSRLLIFSILARALGLFALTPAYGALGAAVAVAAVSAPLSAAIAFFCRKKAGVDPSVVGAWLPPALRHS